MVTVLPFILFEDFRVLLIFLIGYPVLWVVADRHPDFIEVAMRANTKFQRTKNRAQYEGDKYVS